MIDPISKGIDDLGNSLLQALNNVQGFFGRELSVATPVHESVLQLIGNTPLIKLNSIGSEFSTYQFFLKAEFTNPTGSAKDRMALALLIDAEKKGKLKPGAKIYASGQMSSLVSISWVGKARGYKVTCFVDKKTDEEGLKSLKIYGAKIEKASSDPEIEAKLASDKDGAFYPDETENLAIPNFHFKTTGPEIWRDLKESVDAVVSAPGTGAALTGIGRYLKSKNPEVKVICACPETHHLHPKNKKKIPSVFDPQVVDFFLTVTPESALHLQSDLYEKEGIFVGRTTGFSLAGALAFAQESKDQKWEGGKFRNIVILSPDRS